MKKILVTTDFSANSKAGLHFAIQLASQHKFGLTFFHSYYIMIPTGWGRTKFNLYKEMEAKKIQDKLNRFIETVYKNMGITSPEYKCVTKSSVFTESNILTYAMKNNFSFICMSNRGSGKFKRLLGTTTSKLIKLSKVPVIAVPDNYKTNKISSILYASDLINVENELTKVIDFAKPLKAAIHLVHFNTQLIFVDSKIIEAGIRTLSKYEIKLHIENTNLDQPLIAKIAALIKSIKPSMMIMFTEQRRNLFQKVFLASKSAEYSFKTEVPLLVFKKA